MRYVSSVGIFSQTLKSAVPVKSSIPSEKLGIILISATSLFALTTLLVERPLIERDKPVIKYPSPIPLGDPGLSNSVPSSLMTALV